MRDGELGAGLVDFGLEHMPPIEVALHDKQRVADHGRVHVAEVGRLEHEFGCLGYVVRVGVCGYEFALEKGDLVKQKRVVQVRVQHDPFFKLLTSRFLFKMKLPQSNKLQIDQGHETKNTLFMDSSLAS